MNPIMAALKEHLALTDADPGRLLPIGGLPPPDFGEPNLPRTEMYNSVVDVTPQPHLRPFSDTTFDPSLRPFSRGPQPQPQAPTYDDPRFTQPEKKGGLLGDIGSIDFEGIGKLFRGGRDDEAKKIAEGLMQMPPEDRVQAISEMRANEPEKASAVQEELGRLVNAEMQKGPQPIGAQKPSEGGIASLNAGPANVDEANQPSFNTDPETMARMHPAKGVPARSAEWDRELPNAPSKAPGFGDRDLTVQRNPADGAFSAPDLGQPYSDDDFTPLSARSEFDLKQPGKGSLANDDDPFSASVYDKDAGIASLSRDSGPPMKRGGGGIKSGGVNGAGSNAFLPEQEEEPLRQFANEAEMEEAYGVPVKPGAHIPDPEMQYPSAQAVADAYGVEAMPDADKAVALQAATAVGASSEQAAQLGSQASSLGPLAQMLLAFGLQMMAAGDKPTGQAIGEAGTTALGMYIKHKQQQVEQEREDRKFKLMEGNYQSLRENREARLALQAAEDERQARESEERLGISRAHLGLAQSRLGLSQRNASQNDAYRRESLELRRQGMNKPRGTTDPLKIDSAARKAAYDKTTGKVDDAKYQDMLRYYKSLAAGQDASPPIDDMAGLMDEGLEDDDSSFFDDVMSKIGF
jgi:hypothetical protein